MSSTSEARTGLRIVRAVLITSGITLHPPRPPSEPRSQLRRPALAPPPRRNSKLAGKGTASSNSSLEQDAVKQRQSLLQRFRDRMESRSQFVAIRVSHRGV